MIDRSIPYHPVLMVKRDTASFPRCALKAGYSFDFYDPATGKDDWVRVQHSSGQIEELSAIPALFDREFSERSELLPERMLFVRDEKGIPVASAALWYGSPFGKELLRIHWVATDEAHQGKGLCRAMLSRLLERYHEIGGEGEIYLISQTFSYAAISIYQFFGFERYIGPSPEGLNWENYEETAKKAWRLIDEKIGEYKK